MISFYTFFAYNLYFFLYRSFNKFYLFLICLVVLLNLPETQWIQHNIVCHYIWEIIFNFLIKIYLCLFFSWNFYYVHVKSLWSSLHISYLTHDYSLYLFAILKYFFHLFLWVTNLVLNSDHPSFHFAEIFYF